MTGYRTAPRKTNDSPLARLRMDRGMTQGQLAAQVGCLSKDISRWENGVCKPGAAYLVKISAALECGIDDLLK